MTESKQSERIEIRFVGSGITPEQVHVSELREVLDASEKLIQSMVLSANQDVSKDEIYLALTEVVHGSLGLQFRPSRPQIVLPEYQRLTQLINNGAFDRLPLDSNKALARLVKFAQKHQCVAELRTSSSEVPLAVVTQDAPIPESPPVRARTTIYGRVVNAGGRTDPNVHIETLQGQVVICSGDEFKVKQLGEHLYERVGIIGSGDYNTLTGEFRNIYIIDILPYRDTSITTAFEELTVLVGHHFDGVDPDRFVRAIRADDEVED